jgi:hypothetical protein
MATVGVGTAVLILFVAAVANIIVKTIREDFFR